MNRSIIKWHLLMLFLISWAHTGQAEEVTNPPLISRGQVITARVSRNHTGDSFLVQLNDAAGSEKEISVQIIDIRAVPPLLPGSVPAKNRLAELIGGKLVKIYVADVQHVGSSTIVTGRVHVDNTDVAETLVREGHAWVGSKKPLNPSLLPLQNEAKARKVGLWGMPEYQKEAPSNPLDDTQGKFLFSAFLSMLAWPFAWMLARWRLPFALGMLVIAALAFWRGSRRVRELQASDSKPPPDLGEVKRLARRLFLLSIGLPMFLILAYTLWGWLIVDRSRGSEIIKWSVLFIVMSLAFFPPFVLMGHLLKVWARRVGKSSFSHLRLARYTGIAACIGSTAGVALLFAEMRGQEGTGDFLIFVPFLLWPLIFVGALCGAIVSALIGYLIWTRKMPTV
jgi:endonuclease YncB( thermonuclease family)